MGVDNFCDTYNHICMNSECDYLEKKDDFVSIDELRLTREERDQHFFNKGYEYALLHLHFGLKTEKLSLA